MKYYFCLIQKYMQIILVPVIFCLVQDVYVMITMCYYLNVQVLTISMMVILGDW